MGTEVKTNSQVNVLSAVCLVLGVASFVLSFIALIPLAINSGSMPKATYIIIALVAVAAAVVCNVIVGKIKDLGAKMSFLENGSNFSRVAMLVCVIVLVVTIAIV